MMILQRLCVKLRIDVAAQLNSDFTPTDYANFLLTLSMVVLDKFFVGLCKKSMVHYSSCKHEQAVTIDVNAWTDAGHAVNHLYDMLYMMGRDDIPVGVGGDGGISGHGTIHPNVGGYLPLIDQVQFRIHHFVMI
jgi:hypothetical protein